MSISDLSFCDHGYTKIKICPSCLREKDDQIDSLKSLLRSAHEIIYDLHKYEEGDICNEVHESPCGVKVWLSAYSSLTSSKSGMGA